MPSRRLLAGVVAALLGFTACQVSKPSQILLGPVQPSQVLVGTAVTCYAGPSDGLAVFGALHAARRGDIVVATTDGFTATAIAGDLLLWTQAIGAKPGRAVRSREVGPTGLPTCQRRTQGHNRAYLPSDLSSNAR